MAPPPSPSNSPSDLASSSPTNPDPSASPSTSSSMWQYLWIPVLISLSKELSSAKAQSTILLPGEAGDSVESTRLPSCPAADPKLNFRPVIGILSHPGDGASGRLNNASNASYIAASYVKFVEAAGARVIPLIYNEPPDVLYKKLNLVNGVLFTGGWAKSGPYFKVVDGIFKKILEKNDGGDHFPLLAICLGFELLTMIISKDNNILESFKASDQASTLEFAKEMNIEGTVFQRFPPDLLRKLSTDCLVMQNHQLHLPNSGELSPPTGNHKTHINPRLELTQSTSDHENPQTPIPSARNHLLVFKSMPKGSKESFQPETVRNTSELRTQTLSSTNEVARGLKMPEGGRRVLGLGHRRSPDVWGWSTVVADGWDWSTYGISPEKFIENMDLCNFFKILTNSADSDNKVYVSTVQARNYPVTAFQWHPEKNAFEWGLSMIPHSEDAIQVTQYVANFFVRNMKVPLLGKDCSGKVALHMFRSANCATTTQIVKLEDSSSFEARKSLNRPPTRKVLNNLIYNYSPTYCGKAGKGYDEVYIFDGPSHSSL
ncbi:hypothetical protein RHSIM_Rhsim06G0210400 [Rhododendron simsii]|uniref:folate gamma-glutamyl hydrolase n=1 Tax=Rhododendron simsii TaxID=118357 RepID=A0A834GRL5_RHOSS|nr:hypothetical protein RHSIM_Rhsim06G0210400 [Rhododendron simsii]